jgi:hypothetical protein
MFTEACVYHTLRNSVVYLLIFCVEMLYRLCNIYPTYKKRLRCNICNSVHVPYSFIHSSMALQPFVGPWPLLQFRNHFYTDGKTAWTSDQPMARPLLTYRTTQIQNKRTHTNIHALSGIRTHDPSVRASEDKSSCLGLRGHCDRPMFCTIMKYFLWLKFLIFQIVVFWVVTPYSHVGGSPPTKLSRRAYSEQYPPWKPQNLHPLVFFNTATFEFIYLGTFSQLHML